MTDIASKFSVTKDDLAHLGEGSVAYMRQIGSDELKGKFPGLPEIASGLKLWAVFGASGQPILLSDERERALAGVLENDLVPVPLH